MSGQRLVSVPWTLAESIPPAYTEHIGRALIEQMKRAAA